jgi:hypothetical protein
VCPDRTPLPSILSLRHFFLLFFTYTRSAWIAHICKSSSPWSFRIQHNSCFSHKILVALLSLGLRVIGLELPISLVFSTWIASI